MPRKEQRDWYDTPLLYDIVFGVDTAREVDFLEALLARHGPPSGRRVLEPACGSARLMEEFARRGYLASGFDASEAMVRFARERCRALRPRPRVKRARLEDFRMAGRFDLAHCLLSTFKYLLDECEARRHLELVREHLAPGGIYVLGLHLTDYASRCPDHERWVAERHGLRVVCNTHTWPPDRGLRREKLRTRLTVTVVDPRRAGVDPKLRNDTESEVLAALEAVPPPDGKPVLVQETHWECRTYSPRQFRALVRSIPGLEWIETYDFHHDADQPVHLRDDARDAVVVLRRSDSG